MKKNDEFKVKIEDLGNDGEGICRVGDFVIFVKDTAIGDEAVIRITKVKKSFAYARVMEIKKPSPDRIKAPCPHARVCGGCSLMHISYERQLEWKQRKVAQCLKRIGGIDEPEKLMEPIVGSGISDLGQDMVSTKVSSSLSDMGVSAEINDEKSRGLRYRNKAQFPVGTDKDGRLSIGFYARNSHRIINTDKCLLQSESFDGVMSCIRDFFETKNIMPYDEETGNGLIRHVILREGRNTGQIQVCLVINGDALYAGESKGSGADNGKKAGPLPNELESEFALTLSSISGVSSIVINKNTERTNRIIGDETRLLWGKDTIEDTIGGIRFEIGPMSFYQVNPVQTERMYNKALEYANLHGGETVWDLYCGIGTISLFLAAKAGKVYGVEIVPEAIEDARRNALLNGMENVRFFAGKAEEIVPQKFEEEKMSADVVVVDPPRKGCDRILLNTVISMAPARIVYVSCDPATLARDISILTAGGYQLIKACVFDNFAQTPHVETVVLMSKVGVEYA